MGRYRFNLKSAKIKFSFRGCQNRTTKFKPSHPKTLWQEKYRRKLQHHLQA